MGDSEGANNKLIKEYIEYGRKELLKNEKERLLILSQCNDPNNVLYADFRADIICFSYYRFKILGISLSELFDLQKQIPAIYPWNLEYDIFRQDVNRRFNVFPLIIVMARKEKHVVKAFEFARKYNIPLVPRGGAHSFEGFSLNDGMIIDQSRRKQITINCEDRTVVTKPGVLLGPLADALYKKNLVLPVGTCPNNCITGYTLGGGIATLTRMYGLTCDSLLAVKVLLANGEIVIANKDEYPDLYWASQGGAGDNFGIVLSLKFQVYPIDKVWFFVLTYDFSKLASLIETWQNTTPVYPKELIVYLRAAGGSESNVIISGMYLGTNETELLTLLQPYLELHPESQKISYVPYIEAVKGFAGIGRWLPFFKTKNAFLSKPLTKTALDTIVEFMATTSIENTLLLEPLGGRNSEISSKAAAFPYRKDVFGWLLINAHWDRQSSGVQEFKWATKFYNTLKPYLSNKVYVNAPDVQLKHYLRQYYNGNLKRLIKIKSKYDPENIFNYPQSIPVHPQDN